MPSNSSAERKRPPAAGPGHNRDPLLEGYKRMLLIRCAEERLSRMFADGEVPGFIHLSIGQEAVSAGVMAALNHQDTIASTHRGHGHAIAKGLPLDGFFSELLSFREGLCKGRGGSMHVADMSVGMLGANGIVGAGVPIAVGSALSHKVLGRPNVAVAFFGDGALAEGVVHESLNLAKLWTLPVLFVCENNGWGEFLPTSKQLAFKLEHIAQAFGLPYASVDGNDVVAVTEVAESAVAAIRTGSGPWVLECHTTRVRGHFEGDPQRYRDPTEIEQLAIADPITRAMKCLAANGIAEADIGRFAEEIEADVEAALTAARNGSVPSFEEAKLDVYTQAGAN